jgi:spore germination protein
MKLINRKNLSLSIGVIFLGSLFLPSSVKETMLSSLVAVFPPHQLMIRGSIAYWDSEIGESSFRNNAQSFQSVSLFWYFVNSEGDIQKYEYAKDETEIINYAINNNVKIMATLTNLPESENSSWDSKRIEKILESENSRKKHIQQIEKLLADYKYDGVTIDYENVATSQKDLFSQFVGELADSLHKRGKIVGVALHPKSGENKPNEDNGSRSQNWKELAGKADQLYIMAYGEHWDGSKQGPIASYDWVERIAAYMHSLHLPSEKFYLGVPLYGVAWENNKTTNTKGLTFQEVHNLLTEYGKKADWDEKSKSPYFSYEKNGKNFQVWFENAQSVKEKMEIARKYKFAGVSYWRLGGEDPEIWSINKKN